MIKERILVVDDEKNIIDLLTLSLSFEGFEVFSAYRGDEAISKARSNHPDLIVLDVLLPYLDGLEVCRQLKRNISTSDIPVIMLTCLRDLETKLESFKAGVFDYLTKPIVTENLLESIRKALHPGLIIVDDNEDLAFALKLWFEEKGYVVSVAKEAFEAFVLLEEHEYEMAILDYNLGHGPTGLEVYNYIKHMNLPTRVLFITSEIDNQELNRVSIEDTLPVLGKPFKLNFIDTQVKKILRL
ncbi:MAG TPA: response regulator [Candidatus Eremiobacteraeota bacterium]|nr:MAG: Response regulator MprA [bacterium ADurb.Bin363]HPZ09862.1 response regulator [Candidatus Eremiobacteraeota bacterium]